MKDDFGIYHLFAELENHINLVTFKLVVEFFFGFGNFNYKAFRVQISFMLAKLLKNKPLCQDLPTTRDWINKTIEATSISHLS